MADDDSITASVTAPTSLAAGTYDGVRVEACPTTGATGACPAQQCTEMSACTVSGLTTGTAYTVTAQLLKGSEPVSGKGAPQVATPLHP